MPPAFRRLLIPLLIALIAVMAIPALLVASHTTNAVDSLLTIESKRRAVAVGEEVSVEVGRALTLGVPFERLVGMGPYLSDVVADNPGVRYVLVGGAGGAARYEAGAAQSAPDDAYRAVLSDRLAGAGRLPVAETLSDRIVVASSIFNGARKVGYVIVVSSIDLIEGSPLIVIGPLAVVLLATALVVVEFFQVLLFNTVLRPARLIGVAAHRARRRSFHDLVTIPWRDEMGRATAAVNLVVARIADRVDDLFSWAAEIKASQLHPETGQRVDSVMAKVSSRYARSRRAAGRITWRTVPYTMPFLLILLSESLLWPVAPILSHRLMPGFAGNTLWWEGAVASAGPAGLLIATALLGAADATRCRRRIFGGLTVAAIASAFVTQLQDPAGVFVLRFVGGVSTGIALTGAIGPLLGSGTAWRGRGMLQLAASLCIAGICGPVAGLWICIELGGTTPFWTTPGLAVLGMVLCSALLPQEADQAEGAASLHGALPWPALTTPGLRLVVVAGALNLALVGLAIAVIPLAGELGGLTSNRLIELYGSAAIGGLPGLLLGHVLSRRRSGAEIGLVVSSAAVAAALVWLGLSGAALAPASLGVVGLAAMSARICLARALPYHTRDLQRRLGRDRGLAAALLPARLAGVCGPVVALGAWSTSGPTFALTTLGAILGAALLACGISAAGERRARRRVAHAAA